MDTFKEIVATIISFSILLLLVFGIEHKTYLSFHGMFITITFFMIVPLSFLIGAILNKSWLVSFAGYSLLLVCLAVFIPYIEYFAISGFIYILLESITDLKD